MPERNPLTDAMLDLGQSILERHRASMKSQVIPIGEERLTPSELRAKLDDPRNLALRAQMLQGNTPTEKTAARERVLKLYRGKGGK